MTGLDKPDILFHAWDDTLFAFASGNLVSKNIPPLPWMESQMFSRRNSHVRMTIKESFTKGE